MTLKVSLDSAEAQNEISASSDDKVSKISYFPKWRRSENNSVYASDSVVQSDSDTPNICLMEGWCKIMLQYTNGVHITMNDTKTEVVLNFMLEQVDADNNRQREPVANLVMSGEMANRLVELLSRLMNSDASKSKPLVN